MTDPDRFLWVSCQIDQLSRPNTFAGVQSILHSLPRGLNGTYSRILDCIPPENETTAVRALRWLAHTNVPLSLFELVEVIAIEESSSSLDDLHALLVPEDIFQICGSLIRQSEVTGMLHLAHSSVYEFLTDATSHSQISARYQIPAVPSMILLVKTCLIYLSFHNFDYAHVEARLGSRIDVETMSDNFELELLPECHFYDYALKNWWKHLPTSPEDLDKIWPYLDNFFDSGSGNFGPCIKLLHHIENTYRYPAAMQPIHFCATHGLHQVFDRLLRSNIDVECKVEDGRTALHIAAENGHEIIIQSLLARGVDPNAESADGRTSLQLAIESGNEPMAQLLICGGADVNANFAGGETPLSVAVGNRSASLVQLLINEQGNPNGLLRNGRTPLHVAAEVGADIGILTLLLNNGAHPAKGDDESWTALHYAAHFGHIEVADLLMQARLAEEIFGRSGWTPLHAAIEQEHIEIVRLFIKFAKKISFSFATQSETQQSRSISIPSRRFKNAQGTAQIGLASSSSSSLEQVSPGPEILTRGQVPTPLFLASSQGYLAGIDALKNAGASSNDVRACRQLAFAKGDLAVLERLIVDTDRNIDCLLSLRHKDSTTSEASRSILEILFKSCRWNKSNTVDAMKRVIKESDLILLKLLIDQFLLLDDDCQKQAADMLPGVLRIALTCGSIEAMELLETTGVGVSEPITADVGRDGYNDAASCSLLHLAVQLQKPDMVSYLLISIDPNIKDARGRTPLYYLTEDKHKHTQKTVSILFASGADILARDHQGWTPLHMSSHYNFSPTVSSLLKAGARVDVVDNAGMTPLHHCAFSTPWSHQFPSSSMLHLLEAGASTSARNEDGYTPLQLALIMALRANSANHLSGILDHQEDLISATFPPLDRTLLHFAAEANCGSPILRVLFERKANLESQDKNGKTPVQIAGSTAHQLLINRGAQWKK